jgi:hypothetical protein
MLERLDEVSDERVKALGEIERDKLRVARPYNKRVKEICFKSEILFGRQFCLLGLGATRSGSDHQNWEGSYRIEKVISRNSYMVQSIQGTSLPRALNGKYLKMYYPIVWQDA